MHHLGAVSGGEGLSRRTSPGGGEVRCSLPAMSVWSRGVAVRTGSTGCHLEILPMAAVGSAGYRSCASSGGGDIAADPAAARPVLVSVSQGPVRVEFPSRRSATTNSVEQEAVAGAPTEPL